MTDHDVDVDVVVVGAGAAGLCAALEASRDPSNRVLLAEGEGEIGGASAWSTGMIMAAGTRFQRERGIDDTPEALYRDYMSVNGWKLHPAVVRRLTEEAGPTVEWLAELGVEPDEILQAGDESAPRGHVYAELGAGIVRVLGRHIRRRPNVDLALGRRVDRLLLEGASVVGVESGGDEVRCAATVLATGGFGADAAMLREWYPTATEAGDWLNYVGPPSSRGDGIRLAQQAGAEITGRDRGVLRLRPNFSHESEGAYFPGWLVIVNADGQRFMDEMSPYSVQEPLVRAQRGPVWAVFDDATKRAAQPGTTRRNRKLNIPGHPWEDWVEPVVDDMVARGRIHRAETLADLAGAIGVPAGRFGVTIRGYNAGAAEGRDPVFLKAAPEFRTIEQPPFYASELRLWHMPVTAAGPRIDDMARVLTPDWLPVPGLYAAGECAGGVLGDKYVGSGNSWASCVVFGRVAGRQAAAHAGGRAPRS